nr:hypothetical protein [Tanacetum cinerariifolium]
EDPETEGSEIIELCRFTTSVDSNFTTSNPLVTSLYTEITGLYPAIPTLGQESRTGTECSEDPETEGSEIIELCRFTTSVDSNFTTSNPLVTSLYTEITGLYPAIPTLGQESRTVMSDASSVVTYTSVYTDSEAWRYYGEDSAKTGSPRVIVYGYDGLPMQLVAPTSPDYVPGPEHPPSPNYVPGPEHPPSPVEIPYVPEPEYPEYLVPYDVEAHLEDQPLPADASPTATTPGYVPFDDDDDDTDEEDEEPFEDEEDDKEEEEHRALADSSAVSIMDPVPPTVDTEEFETDESAPTPGSPQTIIPFSQTRLRMARKAVRLEPPMSASMEACIARHAALLSPPLPVPAAEIRMRALLRSTSSRTDIPEADVPPRKRACLTTPAPGFESGYGITDTWDEIVDTLMEIAPTNLEGVNQRVTELDTTVRQRTDEFEVRFEEAQDDRALLRARVNTLFRDRPDHCHIAMLLDREAMYAREAWARSEDRIAAIAAHVRTLKAHVATLIAQTSSLQTQLTTTLGRIEILEAREPEPQEGPAEASSSSIIVWHVRSTLGYRAAEIRMRALLRSTSRRTDIPEADVPPRKRACLTTPAPGFKVEQSGYGITDTWDEIVDTLMEISPTTLEGVNQRVTELDTTVRDRPDHCHIAMLLDREAMYAREAWAGSEDRIAAITAHVRTLKAHVATLIAQTSSLQTQLTTTLGRIEILEAREPEPQEGPAEASSSC